MTHDEHPSSGDLRLAELRAAIHDETVDTLIVGVHGHAGPAHGQAGHGRAFLDGVIDHGAHVCTYLLGTDMEMGTPDGFELMNWETGYGDYIIDPDWDTLRCCRGRTAPRWCWATSSTRRPRTRCAVSPRTILKRQIAAAADLGMRIKAGSEFEYYLLTDTYEQAVARDTSASSGSAITTRTTTCSRPPRPSPSTASCAG